MDFDDLDDEVERRLEVGEEVVGHVVENHQPRQGTVLPLTNRFKNKKLAANQYLPQKQKNDVAPYNGEKEVKRTPVIRLLCIHGVADSYPQEWHMFAESAPSDVEVLMHEFPAHGHREGEPYLNTLDAFCDDAFEAFRESMDTGCFALLGHSIGALIVMAVAKRARAELGVEPVMAFMVERGAPQFPIMTDAGWDMLINDRESLMRIWNPMVVDIYHKGGDVGKKSMDAWTTGLQVENEGSREVGWHVFRCPLIVLYAEFTVGPWLDLDKVEDEGHRDFLKRKKVIHQNFQFAEEGRTFTGHFPLFTYNEWDKWTEHSCFQVIKCPNCDHSTIKANSQFKSSVWSALREEINKF